MFNRYIDGELVGGVDILKVPSPLAAPSKALELLCTGHPPKGGIGSAAVLSSNGSLKCADHRPRQEMDEDGSLMQAVHSTTTAAEAEAVAEAEEPPLEVRPFPWAPRREHQTTAARLVHQPCVSW